MRELAFSPAALEDLAYWKKHSPKMLKRIQELVKDCLRNPEDGLGKPERLRYALAGCWSRRMDRYHRMVYTFDEKTITIIALRYDYEA